MKKWIWVALAALGMLAAAFAPWDALNGLALPFTALGALLRWLSLSGGVGNAAAIALYAAICLIPLGFFWKSSRKNEDWMLVLLVPVLAFALYLMINPGMRPPMMQNEVGDVGYAGMVWSVLITWGVLKLLRSSERILSHNIYKALRIFLLICAVEYLVSGVGVGLRDLWTQMAYIRERQYQFGLSPLPNYLFVVLDFAAGAAEGGLAALVLYKGTKLLTAMELDPYGADCVEISHDVGAWCKKMLMIVTLSALALNLGQVMLAGFLVNVTMGVRIPVSGMAIAFGMLALTRLLVQGKEIKDESDLFI